MVIENRIRRRISLLSQDELKLLSEKCAFNGLPRWKKELITATNKDIRITIKNRTVISCGRESTFLLKNCEFMNDKTSVEPTAS